MSSLLEYFKANAEFLHHQARLKILRQKNRRITCNRKDLQQAVGRSSEFSATARGVHGKFFQHKSCY
jgi:hypothetical protein